MSDVSGRLFVDNANTHNPNNNVSPLFGSTGVYPSQTLEQLIQTRAISSLHDIEADQIQPASLDLRLGRKAYRIPASFLPGPDHGVMDRVEQRGLHEIDLSQGAVLEKKSVYLVELQEVLSLPPDVYGIANPKSSTGRLDILTRLITNKATAFDVVGPGYKGGLYLEVAPLSFGVFARAGDRLNQLRLHRGTPSISKEKMTALYDAGQVTGGVDARAPLRDGELVPVTVDLLGAGPGSIVAYKAKRATNIIDLRRVGEYDPQPFWQPHCAADGSLSLEENGFYILATREDVGVPFQLAAEMVPYDSRSGEFRVHYAGFFDPGFGMVDGKVRGSKGVLEVRSYGVPFTLEHGQIVGWLRYAPVAYGRPTKLYGAGLHSNYQGQGLRLAKQFKPWIEPSAGAPRGPETAPPSHLI